VHLGISCAPGALNLNFFRTSSFHYSIQPAHLTLFSSLLMKQIVRRLLPAGARSALHRLFAPSDVEPAHAPAHSATIEPIRFTDDSPAIEPIRFTDDSPAIEPIRCTGDYASWEEAKRESTGYADFEILAKTRASMLKVKSDPSLFERDSFLMTEPEYPFALITGLLRAALMQDGALSVLDFGGALGSSYFQCRRLLPIAKVRWSVVEQPAHVACGRAEIEDEELKFYLSVEECLRSEQPKVLVLSSVLPYLPDPHALLAELLGLRFLNVIVDRTGFLLRDADRLTVQQVPEYIYKASYPAWFLSERKFLEHFEPSYRTVARFRALDTLQPEDEPAIYLGFIFRLRESSARE
jgi:putative methyltransferase (TIGR04325 family)